MDDQNRKQSNAKSESSPPFAMFYNSNLWNSDLWWSSYRGVARMMLRAHGNMSAMVQINRELADEIREIARKGQDTMLGFSENMLHRLSDTTVNSGNGHAVPYGDLYEAAMSGAREIGQAVVNAQVHSFDTLHEYTQATVETGHKSMANVKAPS